MDLSQFDDAALRGYLRGHLEKKQALEQELDLTIERISRATSELVSRKAMGCTDDRADWLGLR